MTKKRELVSSWSPSMDVLHDVIQAWEALPGGTDYRPAQIQEWLSKQMTPAIGRARAHLAEVKYEGPRT